MVLPATSIDDIAPPMIRDATPLDIPWRGWFMALVLSVRRMLSDHMSLVAAGCAFYATLALFPAIGMLIFIYGLMFDARTVEPQLKALQEIVPAGALHLIDVQVHTLVRQTSHVLGLGLAITTLIALWSATSGTRAMLFALNVAYDEKEQRGRLAIFGIALLLTLRAIFAAILAIAVLVVAPALVTRMGMSIYHGETVRLIGLGVLLAIVLLLIGALYRVGPSRHRVGWRWVAPGAVAATIAWLGVSWSFSFYVERISRYDALYGPLAASVGLMMWFYLSVYVVLWGAQLNSRLEVEGARFGAAGVPAHRTVDAHGSN